MPTPPDSLLNVRYQRRLRRQSICEALADLSRKDLGVAADLSIMVCLPTYASEQSSPQLQALRASRSTSPSFCPTATCRPPNISPLKHSIAGEPVSPCQIACVPPRLLLSSSVALTVLGADSEVALLLGAHKGLWPGWEPRNCRRDAAKASRTSLEMCTCTVLKKPNQTLLLGGSWCIWHSSRQSNSKP